MMGLVIDQLRYPTTIRGVPLFGADDHLQQQRLGGGIPKPVKILEAVEHDSEGYREDRSNGLGPRNNVQGDSAVGVTIWKQELDGDRVGAQCPDGVSLSGGATDHGDDGKTWGRQRVRVSSNRGGDGIHGAPPHRSIH